MFSLFGIGSGAGMSKGVTYEVAEDGERKVVDCVFCNIMKKTEPGRIVHENEKSVVFRTIKPYSEHHLLVTPREHIKDVFSLQSGEGGADVVSE